MPRTKTDVAPRESAPLPGAVIDYGDFQGGGLEDVRPDEIRVPIVRALQPMSPQCRPVAQGGLEGAKPGMLFNTATLQMWDGEAGVDFVPAGRDSNFCEYIPREDGGGFRGTLARNDPRIAQYKAASNDRRVRAGFGKIPTPDGTELVETYNIFGLLVDGEQSAQVVVPFTSTGIAAYRNFMSRVTSIRYWSESLARHVTPALWAHVWRLSTTFQSNDKGNWYALGLGLKHGPADSRKSALAPTDPLFLQAAAFNAMLERGRVAIDHAAADKTDTDEQPF
jgi:hypothetical protein